MTNENARSVNSSFKFAAGSRMTRGVLRTALAVVAGGALAFVVFNRKSEKPKPTPTIKPIATTKEPTPPTTVAQPPIAPPAPPPPQRPVEPIVTVVVVESPPTSSESSRTDALRRVLNGRTLPPNRSQ
jgi:hypothetical protein